MALYKKKLTDLVQENYVYASVLFYFGIEFYEYSEQTLEQVCNEKGLKVDVVIDSLESVESDPLKTIPGLMTMPIDLVIAYLKHKHFIFIKQTLPYLAKLVDNYPSKTNCYVVNYLKLIFPLFVEDYIHHIHEEEDQVFSYINQLDKASRGTFNFTEIYYAMEINSISRFAREHKGSDDAVRRIRKITSDYFLPEHAPVLLRVLYSELQNFEKNLLIHARVENEILMPRALLLEKEVKELLKGKITDN